MYKTGDLIVYGSTGVCEVQKIVSRAFPGTDEEKLYYVLYPRYRQGTIYAPVDCTKVYTRPVMTAHEVNVLIDRIPSVKIETRHFQSNQQRSDYYHGLLQSHDSMDLIELVMSAYDKRRRMHESNHSFGEIDSACMEKAESIINGEFSIALNIAFEEVPAYISTRLAKAERKLSRRWF